LQLAGDDSTSLPRMEREEGKSEKSYKTSAILYLDLLGLCVDIEQDRSPPNLESWPRVCRGLYGPSPLHLLLDCILGLKPWCDFQEF
jgi:hypothetical protein